MADGALLVWPTRAGAWRRPPMAGAPSARSHSSSPCPSPALPKSATDDSRSSDRAASPSRSPRRADPATATERSRSWQPSHSSDPMPVVRELAEFDRNVRQLARAAGVQPPAGHGRRVRRPHRAARLRGRDQARAERELREDDPAESPVHQELPGAPEGPARPGQLAAHRRREHRAATSSTPRTSRRCSRSTTSWYLTPGVDRAWMKSLWTPGGALDRGHRGGLPRRPGDAGQLRRLGAGASSSCAEHRALRDRRQPRRQQLQVEHDLRAAARPRAGTGKRDRLPGLSRVLEESPRQVRAGQAVDSTIRPSSRRSHGSTSSASPSCRRPDRRPGPGDGLLRHRRVDRHRHHLRVHALRAQHGAGGRLLAGRRGLAARAGAAAWASSSIRIRSWCRSWCSPSACATARRR